MCTWNKRIYCFSLSKIEGYMKKLKFMLDFGEGPIWTEYFDKEKGRLLTGIEKVDNDKELWDINETIQELFTSYYHFDYNDQACFFDEEQEKKDKYKMLALLEKLKGLKIYNE